MPTRDERYELFLSVASDLERAGTAYDAELIVSTMLGAAYAIARDKRAEVMADTASGLRGYLGRRRTRHAVLLRAVLAAIIGEQPGRPPADPPAWLPHLGAVHPTGAYTFGSGNQVTYLATFAYDEPAAGGPEHVVAVQIGDGHVRDLFIAAPAGALLAQLDAATVTDPAMRLAEIDPGELRVAVEKHLAATDALPELPETRSLTSDRALAGHRLRLLPEPDLPTEPDLLTVADFRAAPEAARLGSADEESLTFALQLIHGFADGDPLRWTPESIASFLLDWVPANAVLDRADVEVVPGTLSAWVRWAGRMSGLEPRAVAQNVAAVARNRTEFARRARSGSHRTEAVKATAELLADGVDPTDEQAVADWLAEYNNRSD